MDINLDNLNQIRPLQRTPRTVPLHSRPTTVSALTAQTARHDMPANWPYIEAGEDAYAPAVAHDMATAEVIAALLLGVVLIALGVLLAPLLGVLWLRGKAQRNR